VDHPTCCERNLNISLSNKLLYLWLGYEAVTVVKQLSDWMSLCRGTNIL